jgi:cyclopropane fatty-acyl-phospholipid synthase-like methyltransferase
MHKRVSFTDIALLKMRDHPGWTILASIGVVLPIYFFTVLHTSTRLSRFALLLPHGRTGTGHFVNLISLAGLVLTALGFWYTYLQLKYANDRIDTYRNFYNWIHKLFEEIEHEKSKEFYFYGSTILPGNISFDDPHEILWFKNEMNALFNREGKYAHVERSVVIVPQLEKYRDTYRYFEDTYVKSFGNKYRPPAAWRSFVHDKQVEAREFQKNLSTKHGGEKLTPMDHRYRDITNAYFFSNGNRVIYAKPLHYVNSPKVGDDLKVQTPHLVGLTSTDSATIHAFREHFREISGDSERDLLQSMYSKHLVSPRYVDAELKKAKITLGSSDVTCDHLAALDHDHFGGKEATDKFLTVCNVKPGNRVLDIGSGLGGPARYIAAHGNCEVVGIELQEDRYTWSVNVTRELEMDNTVSFILGDACQVEIPDRQFTHAVAFLSILHFAEKKLFLRTLGRRVVLDGLVYIEDYIRPRAYTPQENDRLSQVISCPGLLAGDEYRTALQDGGLRIRECCDTTQEWAVIAMKRVEQFEADRSRLIDVFGKDAFNNAQTFNTSVAALFAEKLISGIRIVAERKL